MNRLSKRLEFSVRGALIVVVRHVLHRIKDRDDGNGEALGALVKLGPSRSHRANVRLAVLKEALANIPETVIEYHAGVRLP